MKISIKNRFLIILFSITFLFGILSVGIYQIFSTIQTDILIKIAEEYLLQMTTNIENKFKKIKGLSIMVVTDPMIQNSLKRYYSADTSYEEIQLQRDIITTLQKYLSREEYFKYINAMYIFGKDESVFPTKIDFPGFSESAINHIIITAARNKWENTWYSNPSLIQQFMSLRTIIEYKNYYRTLGTLGTLAIDIDINGIIESAVNTHLDFGIEMAIIFDDKIFPKDNPLITTDMFSVFKRLKQDSIVTLNSKKYLISKVKSSHDEWDFISIFPYYKIQEKLRPIYIFLLLIYMSLFILITYLGIKFTKSITNPLENLVRVIKNVEEDKFDINSYAITEYQRVDEIGILYREFKLMLNKIDTLINENYKKQIIAKDARYRALQAQINPHFLYNTLESINWIAAMNQQERIASMVKALGNLLRISINRKVIFTIRDQINLLNDYITIQKIRYEERLQVTIFASEEVYDYGIPKLIIQPIVENSIKYGLEMLTRQCVITIRITKEEETICLCVSDNGPGMDEEFVRKINLGEVKSSGSGIGIKNISDRLKMIYNGKYKLNITSQPDRGTALSIRIPAWSLDYYYETLNIEELHV